MATTPVAPPPTTVVRPLRKRWRLVGGCLGCLGVLIVAVFIAVTVGLLAWALGLGNQDFYIRAQIPYWIILIVFVVVVVFSAAVSFSATVGIRVQRFFQ